MIIFKNSADTMEGVLKNAKHATDGRPRNIERGDIILISQTKKTLRPGQKPIRWMMDFVSCEEDRNNESDRIWGRHWKYLITGENLRSVEPFDIDDIKVTSKNYGAVQTHCPVESEDEEVVLKWISESRDLGADEGDILEEEFKDGGVRDPDEIIRELDRKYSGTPEFKKTIVRAIQRPSSLSNALKEKYGYTCRICGYPGFRKRGGGMYAETHHMIELNNQAPKTLQSWNVLVVCPLCHKKLHYADVETEFLNPGWRIVLEGKEHILR